MASGVIRLVRPSRAIQPIEHEPSSTSSLEAARLLQNHFTSMVRPAPESFRSNVLAGSPVLAGFKAGGAQQIRGGVFAPKAQGVGGNFL